jgi:hypothetical protein
MHYRYFTLEQRDHLEQAIRDRATDPTDLALALERLRHAGLRHLRRLRRRDALCRAHGGACRDALPGVPGEGQLEAGERLPDAPAQAA